MLPIEPDDQNHARQRAMEAFATAPSAFLAERYAALERDLPPLLPVRGPEIGLVMLRGRTGGGGAPFNLGEASVARASVRLASGEVGHAVILGRDGVRAQAAAHLDAAWQRPDLRARIESEIVAPAFSQRDADRAARAEETEATRVDFFTMVRGED